MRPTLTMCRGLPGSGKTTWALKQLEYKILGETVRVNQDEIRKELGWISWATWDFSSEAEKRVYVLKAHRIADALTKGLNVISDDTNFGRKRKVEMTDLARVCGADFRIQDFTKVPIDQCIRWDASRPEHARVGERVIRKMAAANQLDVDVSNDPAFAYTRFAPVVQNLHAQPAIICDLDGTLADFTTKGHRGPYDASRCAEDDVVRPVLMLLNLYDPTGTIIYLSGRENKYREQTLQFLTQNNCPKGSLFMRETGDKRKDWIVKGEIFDAFIRGQFYIDFVLDDRDQVVNFWRHIGLTCFQVAAGAF